MSSINAPRESGIDHTGRASSHDVATEATRARRYGRSIIGSCIALALSFIWWVGVACFYGNRQISIPEGYGILVLNLTPAAISTILIYTFAAMRWHVRWLFHNQVVGWTSALFIVGAIYWFGIWPYLTLIRH
jgi:hypothetical protein